MTSLIRLQTVAMAAFIISCVAPLSMAERTEVSSHNLNNCDVLLDSDLLDVDELGRDVFPADELINTDTATVNDAACPEADDPALPNERVLIINETDRFLSNLWYVADEETTLSNFDGAVNGDFLAFRIDRVGTNRPLVRESMTVDDIFEPGEEWEFIIDDYTNAIGLGAWEINSIGVPSIGGLDSSGSIISIPEPSSSLLVLLGLGTVLLRRSRKL